MFSRLDYYFDRLRSTFGFFTGVFIVGALVLGFGLPALDDLLEPRLPLLAFDSLDSARAVLTTVATATVSVAGLSFSVTLVAFTLSSSQLSPRVLRSFRTDSIVQLTLAVFLGTFVYCLVVLVRLGSTGDSGAPALSMTVAVLAAIGAFVLFAVFISHIVELLQPSSVIESICGDALATLAARYPTRSGRAPSDPAAAARAVASATASPGHVVRARDHGYLSDLHAQSVIGAAVEHEGLVGQRTAIGAYVVPGDVLAEVWCADPEALAEGVRSAFVLDRQRSPLRDLGFPVRQLSDIALKGLSPGVNDPTTALNAMEAMTAVLVGVAEAEPPSPIRTDEQDVPRLVAVVPDLDALVRLGFEQVRVFATADPAVGRRLAELLKKVARSAARHQLDHEEVLHQLALLAHGSGDALPTAEDAGGVRSAARPGG